MYRLAELKGRLNAAPAVLVSVVHTQGSVSRDAGAWMAVFANQLVGTIGGGQLEYQAQALALGVLSGQLPAPAAPQRFPLGPALGQCCGGVVELNFECINASD